MTERRLSRSVAAICLTLLLFVCAGGASAATLHMTGGWLQQRGPVYIPSWITALGGLNKSVLGICCDPTIPGAGFVTVTPTGGTGPAAIAIPQHLFQLYEEGGRAIPLQKALSDAFGSFAAGNVIQLTTKFRFNGPANPAALSAGADTVRLAPNFPYCPGATSNPNCATNIAGGADGTAPGRISYTAGANQFGGAMAMIIAGTGEVANSLGGTPLRVRHDAIAGAGSQQVGQAYGFMGTVVLLSGMVTTGHTITPNGLIGMAGTTTSTATPDTNENTGFPWTTGMLVVSEPGGVTTMDKAETYTLTGYDNRTPGGRGNISLVAGGISKRLVSGQTFVSADTVTMDISSGQLTPALSAAGVAAVASLLIIGGGYVLRKRL